MGRRNARVDPRLSSGLDISTDRALWFLGSLEQITLIRSLAARFNLPMVVHMMDDWPAVLHTSGLLSPIMGPPIRQELGGV